jgi:hypothetical protein
MPLLASGRGPRRRTNLRQCSGWSTIGCDCAPAHKTNSSAGDVAVCAAYRRDGSAGWSAPLRKGSRPWASSPERQSPSVRPVGGVAKNTDSSRGLPTFPCPAASSARRRARVGPGRRRSSLSAMIADTVALIESATHGLRRRPDIVEMIALFRAVHLLARAQANDGDQIAAAVPDLTEAVGDRLTAIVGDLAALAQATVPGRRYG